MKILALEFSSHLRSVAVAHRLEDGATHVLGSGEDADYRGVTGLMLIDCTLRQAQVKPADLAVIALGLGPGSYTGIRSAIALAQGWQLGRGVQVVGISSTLCLAEEGRRRGVLGNVGVVVDAQRGDVYIHKYRLESKGVSEVEALRIVPRSAISAGDIVIGPEASKFISSGMDLCPSAATLAGLLDLAVSRPAEQLEPVYLRETTFVKAPPARQIE
jgi:tRNA threonylcarbamoyladenosine biosynthesis protein TsaB